MTVTAGFTRLIAADAALTPSLGAPGVYFAPAAAADRLDVEAMDVTAFAGVARRGPAWITTTNPQDLCQFRARSVAVPIDSWDAYVDLFGGDDGSGLLARAVSAYFAQGARRAYVIRVVASVADEKKRPKPAEPPPGCTTLAIRAAATGGVWLELAAANEGSWGNDLQVEATFTRQRLGTVRLIDESDGASSDQGLKIAIPKAGLVTAGATLRFRPLDQTSSDVSYGVVDSVTRELRRSSADSPYTARLRPGVNLKADAVADVIEVDLTVVDQDSSRPRQEEHKALGLDPAHPRYLGAVLTDQSQLVQSFNAPDPAHLAGAVRGSRLSSEVIDAGRDRWEEIQHTDFFSVDEIEGTGGVDAVLAADEVATIVAPDLYWPAAARPAWPSLPTKEAPASFVACMPAGLAPPVTSSDNTPCLMLDPREPAGRCLIIEQQQKLIETATRMNRIALVDVPPGLTTAEVLSWRAQFDSAFAAAYHPWPALPAPLDRTVAVTPSAVAAGIIARSELESGIARGPANVVATGVVDVDHAVPAGTEGMLHRLGVNVFVIDPEGVRLTAARTLSSDAQWRQLSVRRLLLSIDNAVRHQLQWCVFENNDDRLRDNVRTQLNALMARFFAQGCFAGATPEESWFVRLAPSAEATQEMDDGRLVAEIGVAPAEPVEFVIVRVAIQAEGEIKSSFSFGAGVSLRA